jgi:hypothetical protein
MKKTPEKRVRVGGARGQREGEGAVNREQQDLAIAWLERKE